MHEHHSHDGLENGHHADGDGSAHRHALGSHDHHHADGGDPRDQCVALVPIFNHLEPNEIHEVATTARQKVFGRNERLYGAGDQNPYLLIIHRGRVKIHRSVESGHEQLIRVLEPGDFIGETAFITGGEMDHYATTLEECEICVLHRDDVRRHLLKYPAITYKMLEAVSNRLGRTEHMVNSLTGEDVEHRIAAYLVDLADEAGATSIRLPISKKDLASYLGTTPESLSRKLSQFENAGWIQQEGHRRIIILDYSSLELA